MKVSPFVNATEHLQAYLGLATLLARRHVARYSYRLLNGVGSLDDSYVAFQEAIHVMEGARVDTPVVAPAQTGWPSADEAHQEVIHHRERIAQRLNASHEAEIDVTHLPVEELRARFGLSTLELEALMCVVAGQLSVDVSRLYRFALGDFTLECPTIGFVTELVSDSTHVVNEVHDIFMPQSALGRAGLMVTEPSARTPSRLRRAVRVPDRLVDFVRGRKPQLPLDLQAVCETLDPDPPDWEQLVLEAKSATVISHAWREAARPGGTSLLALCGARGVGRQSAFRALARGSGLEVLIVVLERMSLERLEHDLRVLLNTAQLQRCAVLLRGERRLDDPEFLERAAPILRTLVMHHRGVVAFTVPAVSHRLRATFPMLHEVTFARPDRVGQELQWRQLLQVHAIPDAAKLSTRLVQRFDLTPGFITRAVRECHRRRRRAQRASEDFAILTEAVVGHLEHGLGALASRESTPLTWDDVVLSDTLRSSLREVLSHAQNQAQVFDAWGFGRKLPYGRGISCLFTGPPGTGKTMMAGVLARSLERELYRVDIARVVSKWIGETEKNLGQLFDEADAAQAVLFFDEADSLFSRRTEVRGSNDRFANMEVNFLLQRMESYTGIAILATNLDKGIDDAFKRRFRFVIRFPMPDPELRAQLWRSMLPRQARVDRDLDFEVLGERFELAGGSIKNAVLRAAFWAADAETPITQELLERAAFEESSSIGKLIRRGS